MPTFELCIGKQPQGWSSFSSHRAHKFTFKPSQWQKKRLILVWWRAQGRHTGAYQCTWKVRQNPWGLLQVSKESRGRCVQVKHLSKLAFCHGMEETSPRPSVWRLCDRFVFQDLITLIMRFWFSNYWKSHDYRIFMSLQPGVWEGRQNPGTKWESLTGNNCCTLSEHNENCFGLLLLRWTPASKL